MGVWQSIKHLFASGSAAPAEAVRLDGSSKQALSRALGRLVLDQQGWISFAEARALFSTADPQYAFGEMDDDGKASLASFAEAGDRRYDYQLMPMEGRVYFTHRSRP